MEYGNIIKNYAYDATNMLTAVDMPGKGSSEYTYNGFRNRVAKLENMDETKYIMDMTLPYDNLLMTRGTQSQSFTWGNGVLFASDDSNDTTFQYLHDHLGSPIRLFSSNTNTVIDYDEFGLPKTVAGAMQPFGFTGYITDNATDLLYAQARYYEPNLNRFMAEDTVRDGLNNYAYCKNNPLGFIDKTGLWDKEVHEEMTIRWALEMGFCIDFATDLGVAVQFPDTITGGYSFLPGIGNQGIHFNRFDPGHSRNGFYDSRDYYGDLYLNKAIEAWNAANYSQERLENYWAMLMDAINQNNYSLAAQIGNQISNLPTHDQDMKYLGIALHAQQDISAHGQIGSGSNNITGRAYETLINIPWFRYALLALIGDPAFKAYYMANQFPYTINPDNLNYRWDCDREMLQLIRFLGDMWSNPRVTNAMYRTSDFLERFAFETNIPGIISLRPCPDDTPSEPDLFENTIL